MANVLKPRNDQWSGRDSSKAILFAAKKYLEVDTREGDICKAPRDVNERNVSRKQRTNDAANSR